MLCSDCDEEREGVLGYRGRVGRQVREEEQMDQPVHQKEGKGSK